MNSDYLIGDCLARAKAISLHAERLANEEFPSDQPRNLARALARLAKLMAEHLVEYRSSPTYNPTRDLDHIRNVDGVLKLYSEPLRFVDGAVSRKVPWSFVGALQELSRRVVPNVVVMLRPKWRYNYSIVLDDLAMWLQKAATYALPEAQIREALDGLGRNFYTISFPYIERKSVLLHAILAHEIGHLVIRDYISADDSPIPNEVYNRTVETVKRDVSSGRLLPIQTGIISSEIGRRLQEVSKYQEKAIEEIGSDLVGIQMLGPAALFAYYTAAMSKPPDKSPKKDKSRYPPWRSRIRYGLDQLKRTDLCEWDKLRPSEDPDRQVYFDAYRKYVEEIEDFALQKSPPEEDPLVKIAYEWFDHTLPRIIEYVGSRCERSTLSERPFVFWQKICRLAHVRLAHDLPPNTIDDTADPKQPATMEEIMNSAWLFRLAKLKPCPSSAEKMSEYLKSRDRLDRLTLRALELAHLERKYSSLPS